MKKLILVITVIMYSNLQSFAQGCSDAGFCTIPSLKPNGTSIFDSTKHKNIIRIGLSTAVGDYNINVHNAQIAFIHKVSKNLILDAKLTTQAQNGNNIKTAGLSDVFINANYKLNNYMRVNVGTKIPTCNGNIKQNNLSLPMNYQVSLGTIDAIVGLIFNVKKIQFATALQQPLTQNANAFLAGNFIADSVLKNITSTNNFNRAADALFRVTVPIKLSKKLSIAPGLLPIYHLANDKYNDASNTLREIVGSKGLTLNTNLFANYSLNKNTALMLSYGMPVIVRDVRPDGLTRKYVLGLDLQFGF